MGKVRQMDKVPVILNPSAHSEKGKNAAAEIRAMSPRIELIETGDIVEVKKIARDVAQSGGPVLAAAGGDGTINAVISSLAGSETALGIFPTGTMNLFARELQLPRKSLQGCWQVIEEGVTRKVDLFGFNDGIFVQVAGVGLDARIIEETTWERKKKFGKFGYLMTALSVTGQEAPRIRVFPEGHEPLEGAFVLIGNGSLYGPAFRLFRHAANDDGLLEILVFDSQSRVDVMRYLTAFTMGQMEKAKGVSYVQAPSLRVQSDSEVPVEVDGEFAGYTPVEFFAMEQGLNVLVPGD
ncbi:MAG: diacylglycerol kinase family lipid kinase [Verrucomicrobiaceae bacterium]|nr:diacylglycerol kinase family lipid kinase [Verrucomicrobiaceae bacterium]